MPLSRLSDTGGGLTRLDSTSELTRLAPSSEGFSRLGKHFTIGDKIGGFAVSTVESFPELFGIEPSDRTQEFRAANPVSGFLSQAVGAFVPYLGAAKLARAVPLIEGGLGVLEGLGNSALTRGALGAAGEAAVVEAGRLAISATPAPEAIYEATTGRDAKTRPLGTMVGEAGVNILGGAVLGGAFGGLAARFAKGQRIEDLVPGAAPDQPLMLQTRALNEALGELEAQGIDNPEVARLAKERDQRLKFNLLDIEPTFTDTGETVRGKNKAELGKAYGPLEGERSDKSGGVVSRYLNNANNWRNKSPDKLTATRRLIYDPGETGGYRSETELADDLTAIGKSREELGLWAQDIKTIEVRPGQGKQVGAATTDALQPTGVQSLTPEQSIGQRLLTQPQEWNTTKDPLLGRARGIQRRFTSKPFADVGEGWRMAKEKNGLYVMAKKIAGSVDAAPGDKWVFLRTDRPDQFAMKAARSNDVFMRSAYLPKAAEMEKIGDPLYDAGNLFLKEMEVQPTAKVEKRNAVQAMARDSAETIGTYAAPTAPLGTRNPLLNRAFQYLKNIESLAEARVDQLMRGSREFHGERSLLRNVLTLDPPATEGLAKRIGELEPKDLADIRFVLESETPFEAVQAAHQRVDVNGDPLISKGAHDFLQAMQLISDNFTGRVSKLQAAQLSDPAAKLVAEFQARKGHYALTREFPGAYRIFLNDEKGEVIGMATGADPKSARDAAADIIQQQAKRGRIVREGGLVDEALRNPEELQKIKAKVLRPGFLKNRGDLLGYELQHGELTADKLRQLVEKNLRRRENYIRDVSIYEQMGETLATLNRQRPQDAIALEKRMRAMHGDEGEFARVQNALMDKTLHAVGFSGKDSASAIVRTTQKLLTSFQFNFGNLTQPILNMIGTFQTILPEISYVLHASPEALARNYVSVPLLDGQNNVKGTMGILSEWKLFGNAMQRMGVKWKDQPDDFKGLVEEMVRQRQLAPRFAEEQFGVDGAILRDPIAAFKSTKSFVNYFESANTLLISKSEELNRMMVVNSAYELAKLMDMDYGRMVHFTREMMGKTAFNYGTADRATVFTTPLGSLAGTFKNWMFHYMANMLKYVDDRDAGSLPALFWQTAATALIGGAAATPFVLPVADGASKWLTDKRFMENLYAGVGQHEWAADGLMYGLPGALGVSFSSQAASPGANPMRDASMIFSFAAADRVKNLSTATKDALVAYKVSGEGPWEDQNVRNELVRALAPRTFYRSMALTQDLAVKSLSTNYDVTKGLGLGGAALYAAGFNPTELEKSYEVYNNIRNDQRAQRAAMMELGQTLAQAWETGDDRLANRTFSRAMSMGLDTSSVLRSAQARAKRQGETQLDFASSPEDQASWEFMFDQQ